jgi:hypothetical protein
MSLKTHIHGKDDNIAMDIIKDNGWSGPPVFTDPLRKFDYFIRPLLNDTFGAQMAQNVTFGGTPELIHNGGDATGWTGAAIQGTWNFADTTDPDTGSAHVSITSANDQDTASFSDATETDMSNYTAVTGRINLVTYTGANHNIEVQFYNNSIAVGTPILLNTYIDTGVIGTYQSFVIPKADLGVGLETVDELQMTIERTGGGKPTIRLDNMQIEETGEPAVFTLAPDRGTRLYLQKTVLSFIDNVGSAVSNGTVPGLSYNKILGLNALTNGIGIRTQVDNETFFSTTSREMSDFLSGGGRIESMISDGTNTMAVIEISFQEPIVLDSSQGDCVKFTINDDMSSLISFQTLAVGKTEKINSDLEKQ